MDNYDFLINLSVAVVGALIGAFVGAYSGNALIKKRERKYEKTATVNLLEAFKKEMVLNNNCVSICIKGEKEFKEESAPISFEVFKTIQSTSFVYKYLFEEDFWEYVNDTISKLRRFKQSKSYTKIFDIDKKGNAKELGGVIETIEKEKIRIREEIK